MLYYICYMLLRFAFSQNLDYSTKLLVIINHNLIINHNFGKNVSQVSRDCAGKFKLSIVLATMIETFFAYRKNHSFVNIVVWNLSLLWFDC